MTRSGRLLRLVAAAVLASLVLPLGAAADDDPGDEVRRSGTCTRSSDVEMRLRADDGRIRVELEIETGRRGAAWNVIVLHERRTAFRGTLRTGSNGSLELRRNDSGLVRQRHDRRPGVGATRGDVPGLGDRVEQRLRGATTPAGRPARAWRRRCSDGSRRTWANTPGARSPRDRGTRAPRAGWHGRCDGR